MLCSWKSKCNNRLALTEMPATLGVDMANVSQYIYNVIGRVAANEKVYTEGVTVKFGAISFVSATELTLNGELVTSRNTFHAYPTMNTGIKQAVFEAYLEGASASSKRRIVHTILSLRG